MAQWVKHLPSAQVMIPGAWGRAPPWAPHSWGAASLSASHLPPLPSPSLCFSKIKKNPKKERRVKRKQVNLMLLGCYMPCGVRYTKRRYLNWKQESCWKTGNSSRATLENTRELVNNVCAHSPPALIAAFTYFSITSTQQRRMR